MDIFYTLINVLAGLGTFLLGFHLLSENMEKIAGNKLRTLFNKTSDKKLVGVGMGLATTMVVQSSSVTTVMVVGFVNAGLMSLYQAAAVIMGANIGTTITAQLVALQSFDIVAIATALAGVGTFMIMFTKKDKTKMLGLALAGLGLVFIGLDIMSGAMSDFRNSPVIVDVLGAAKNPFLLLLIGVAVTAIVQSSSAVTSIIISMVGVGFVIGDGGNSVLYVILGTNIGTCVTALLSSLGANKNAKRACLIHFLFNTIGALLFTIVLLIFPQFMNVTFAKWFTEPTTQIAMFHTFFNVVCTILFLPFAGLLVKLTQIIIPDKEKEGVEKCYMDERFLSTPSIAINQLRKAICQMSDMAMESLNIAFDAFMSKDIEKAEKVLENNNEIFKTSEKLTSYLIQVSASNISMEDEKEVNALHNNASDIVRIAELADNVTKYTRKEISQNLIFSNVVREGVSELYQLLVQQNDIVRKIVSEKDYALIAESDEKENEIDRKRKALSYDHIERLNRGECKAENNTLFVNLISNLERIGDHMNYMAHSIENIN